MKFNRREIGDLLFAGFMISLAFAILFSGGYSALTSFDSGIIIALGISFFTAGAGFLLHEIMHKYYAQKYGLNAEFKAFRGMLWVALALSFFGFIFAAPGAVFIWGGLISREKNGKISLAGPMTNIVLAFLFLVLLIIFSKEGFLGYFLSIGLTINSLLGAFNMIPIMPFDGAKIIAWNKSAYILTAIIAVGLYFASYMI